MRAESDTCGYGNTLYAIHGRRVRKRLTGGRRAATIFVPCSNPREALARRANCPACAEEDRDDGDGFCEGCGHRLVFASGAPVIPPAEVVGRWSIGEARASDDFKAKGDGGSAIVVVGALEALTAEVSALEAMRGDGRFPRLLEDGRGPALGVVPRARIRAAAWRTLADRSGARTLSVREALATLRQAFALAEAVELARFDWVPMRSDAFLDERGELFFVRLRSGRRLGPGERLDARTITEAVGGALLPEPGIRRIAAPGTPALRALRRRGGPPVHAGERARRARRRRSRAGGHDRGGPIARCVSLRSRNEAPGERRRGSGGDGGGLDRARGVRRGLLLQ